MSGTARLVLARGGGRGPRPDLFEPGAAAPEPASDDRSRWRDLVAVRLPEAARQRTMPFSGGERPGSLVEVGWSRGIATRAARLALADLFDRCGIAAVVAFTASGNGRSRRVMERLGMTHDPIEDLDHPALRDGEPLRRHVLYRLSAGADAARPA